MARALGLRADGDDPLILSPTNDQWGVSVLKPTSWLRNLAHCLHWGDKYGNGRQSLCRRFPVRRRPRLEALEDRTVPSTFKVTTTIDGSPGSLRQAVLDANANPGADTIVVPAGTCTLAQGELDLTDDATVKGAGASFVGSSNTVVDGNSLSRVFRVVGARVTMADVTIMDGLAPQGGDLRNDGGAVSLVDCLLWGNEAAGASIAAGSAGDGLGGAIYQAGGTLELVKSVLDSNFALGEAVLSGGSGFGRAGAVGASSTPRLLMPWKPVR
jgi:hypothetical protein